ncbi:phosphomannomutase [Rheinheimera sp. 1928-s]|uniref:phosphomannomutase n=1 Tax=Rheinheimera sp. 1928-s TaxID=3033803 RepID=UPI002623F991|nr:phosphomannomutase [Rheinheimera sp. 1928-s]MDF3125676.1 phosphomannomutase [Rheinheimera sp. 1928-s]
MAHFISSELIRQSSVQFGTSGARGLVVDFTPQLCCAFTLAFIQLLQQNADVQRIALAIDNRPSSPEIAAWCAAAVQQLGIQLDYYGVIPTPALAYAAMKQGIAAIMVTGSHIPFDRNGLKFYRPQGEITKQDELQMLAVEVPFSRPAHSATLTANPAAAEDYKQRYLDWFPKDLAKGLTIGIYEHSSAGRDIYAELLQQLGACVIRLGRSDHFVPVDTEAVSEEDEQKAVQWTQAHQLDLLFSTDGDGDRPLVADEQGRWLRGDMLGLLAAKALNIQALAVPVSCNTAIEQSGYFLQVLRSRIGSPYVIEAFGQLEQHQAVAGFEANGGFLLASDLQQQARRLTALPTRDAVLPLLALIELAKGRVVSELLSELPERFTASQRLSHFATELSQQLLSEAAINTEAFVSALGLDAKVLSVDTTDGLRLSLSNGDIVHLRPSGNAPELRCYAESVSEQKAKALVGKVLAKVLALSLHP